uniref:Zinc finger CCCH domain-containing protein 62 n=1 Tax=Noccaea caerulescens TaxID=107243 RepID=A0A1J3G3U9_NOCCA
MSDEKVIIDLCSSEEEEEDDFGDENNCEEELDETEQKDEEEEEDTSSSEDDSDWSHDEATEESDVEYDENDETWKKADDNDDDEDDDIVTRLLTAGSDLKAVNVKECKAYLRKHGLRLSGTKAVFIERIVEHWRIKDGSGEALYPRSSFAINCKGDVCKGDTVLFTQKVHHKYEKMKGSGKIMGRRTVAGQVVKESYGTAKQQHTFTIQVLWCEGVQKLPPLYPLLVKGRNLYRLMTLRQRWANEQDRVKILSEKHSRGAAARKIMRERKIKSGYVLKDGRLQKPCQVKTRNNALPNQNPSQGHKNPTMNPPFHSYNSHTYAPPPPPNAPPPPRAPRPYMLPFNVPYSHHPRPNIHPSHAYAYSIQRPPPPAFYNGRPTSNALQGQSSFNPRASTHAMPPVTHQRRPHQNHHSYHGSSNSGYNYGVRDLDHFSDMMISHRREGDVYRQSENTRGPYTNHHTNSYHSNSNSGYNHGDTQRHQSRDTYRPNHR